MIKGNKKFEDNHQFPVQELGKYIRQGDICKKITIAKDILSSKAVMKYHSKSLCYSNNINKSFGKNGQGQVSRTGISIKPQYIAQQTLNEQLLGVEKRKPATSEYKSGRNGFNRGVKLDTKNYRISLRNSINYSKIVSIAGVPLNEKQAKQRVQSCLNTKVNIRKANLKRLQKQNQKIAVRLDSQQSQYSTKKILKDYQIHQTISKRLTQSKLSRRSNISQDDRSVCSQDSSRASIKSNQSRTSSMKSTSRMNSSKSSSRNQGANRLQSKLRHPENVKIIEHNILKISKDQLSKFKNIFANSFTTTNNSTKKNQSQNSNLHLHSFHGKMLKNNTHVDVQVLSQKSQTNIKNKKSINQDHNYYSSIQGSNRKLRQINFESQSNKNQNLIKKSSVITSDGLLHRIVEEMYNKNGTDDLQNEISKNKIQNKPVYRSTQFFQTNQKMVYLPQTKKRKQSVRNQMKYAIFPTHQIFSKF